MAKGNSSHQQQDNYYPPQQSEVINQIPDQIPPMQPLPPQAIGALGMDGYNQMGAQAMAKEISQTVKNAAAQQENAYDSKKMERMVKGMSLDQQTAMARQFNHYALLEGLKYQFEHLDELEADINNAFAKLADSREES